jgi:hypothetical protein
MIGALIALISLDVCEKLIGAGIIASTLTITAASNTTPIVVQTSAPHHIQGAAHGVVAGVAGNTAANGTWVLTPVSTTGLALSSYLPDGTPVDSAGSGVYTGGGTVQTALPDGRIRVGRKWRSVNGAPPRITFAPVGSPAWVLEPYGGAAPPSLTSLPQTLSQMPRDMRAMRLSRQCTTERSMFDVYVYGAMNPPQPDDGDYDITQAIAHQVVESCFRLVAGRWEVLGGKWESNDEAAPKFDALGQEYSFRLRISQPVTAIALQYVPASTHGTLVVDLAGGSSGDDTTIVLP